MNPGKIIKGIGGCICFAGGVMYEWSEAFAWSCFALGVLLMYIGEER